MSRRGRPTRADVASTRRVEFMVTADEHSALRRVAIENEAQVASVIREAVNSFVADYSERRVFTSGRK